MVGYQRATGGTTQELNGLLFKYKLAKALTLLSLVAVITMTLASVVFPDNLQHFFGDNKSSDVEKESAPTTSQQQEEQSGVKTATECRLPSSLHIPSSGKGQYTPPAPHDSVLKAVKLAHQDDIDAYCQHWDPVQGFDPVIPYNTHGECGNWQDKYTELHQQRLEQLERLKAGDIESFTHDDPPLYVSYLCKEVPANSNRGCGGLADRMSGMISTFFYALLTNRAYLAHWANENPIPLEILFEQPNVNWTYQPNQMKTLFTSQPENELMSFQQVDTLNQNYDGLGSIMFRDGPSQDFAELWNASYVEVRSNRAYIIRTFDHSTHYPAILAKLGLTKENAFGCIADYLFRPTIGARKYINAYRELFALRSVLSIGIQIRTNDQALANPQNDDNTLEKWFYYFKCANEFALAKKTPHHQRIVYFLVTDSHKLRDEFEQMNEDASLRAKYLGVENMEMTSTVVTNLPLEHIEPDQVAKYIDVEIPLEVSRERMTPGVNSAMMENWLLGYTDLRVISPQGYGKMAAFHSRSDHTTISLPRLPSKAKSLNCADPKVTGYYDLSWLSHQWSLG
ncbi:unnamed protein product [Absidia cylindrospora]